MWPAARLGGRGELKGYKPGALKERSTQWVCPDEAAWVIHIRGEHHNETVHNLRWKTFLLSGDANRCGGCISEGMLKAAGRSLIDALGPPWGSTPNKHP